MSIEYRLLAPHECGRIKEINPARFIKRAWRSVNGIKQWVDLDWLDDDYPDGYDNHFDALQATFEGCGFAIGAFDGDVLVGFVSVNRNVFGSRFKYVLLDQLFVDNKYQGQGIGKNLFRLSAEKAKEWDVNKFYICAGSSENTLAFYKTLGCVEAMEIDQALQAADENDMQLEYALHA
jgi:predicted N-acetyltransferase YhbS